MVLIVAPVPAKVLARSRRPTGLRATRVIRYPPTAKRRATAVPRPGPAPTSRRWRPSTEPGPAGSPARSLGTRGVFGLGHAGQTTGWRPDQPPVQCRAFLPAGLEGEVNAGPAFARNSALPCWPDVG